jgi:hypothetical protein
MSVYSMMYIGVGPVGAMVAGFAAEGIGARLTIVAGAAICAAAAVAFALRLPVIRPVARQLVRDQRAQMEAEVEILDPAPAPQ